MSSRSGIPFKICGLTRRSDARAASEVGATYGGVILATGSPRTVGIEAAAVIFKGSDLVRCGVFVDPSLDEVAVAVARLGLDVVQLHGDESRGFVERVRSIPGVTVWKALRPRSGAEFVAGVERYAGVVDALLVDGWSAAGRGGTGSRFPWEEVARRRSVLGRDVAFVAAGGLTPENVVAAIEALEPDVVDVSSGVERAPGIKDVDAMARFAAAVRSVALPGGIS